MKTLALRDLQNNGAAALEGLQGLALVKGRTLSFFVIPAQEGLEELQAGFLERGLAKAALMRSQLLAVSTGLASLSMDEITQEVKAVRRARIERRRG